MHGASTGFPRCFFATWYGAAITFGKTRASLQATVCERFHYEFKSRSSRPVVADPLRFANRIPSPEIVFLRSKRRENGTLTAQQSKYFATIIGS
jgi:hypothetical protein